MNGGSLSQRMTMPGRAEWHPARELWPVVGITLLAFTLGSFRLGSIGLRGDEAFVFFFCRWPLAEMIAGLRSVDPHPPLYHLLLRGWMACLGTGEITLRFPSLLAHTLLAPLVYAVGRRWQSARAGLWGAALVAINPFLLWQAQDARMYALLAAWSLACLWYTLRVLAIRVNDPDRPGVYAGYVLTAASALLMHYYGMLFVAGVNVGFFAGQLSTSRSGHKIRRWLLLQALAVAPLAVWLIYAGRSLLGHEKDWIRAVSLPDMIYRLLRAFSVGTTFSGQQTWLWVVASAALCLLGLIASWQRVTRAIRATRGPILQQAAVMTAALVVPLIGAFLISLWRPAFEERYLVSVAPVYLLFAAHGMVRLQSRYPLLAISVIIFLAGGIFCSLYSYHALPAYAKSPDWRGVMAYVRSQQQAGDLLILNYPDPTQEYYNGGYTPFALLPAAYPFAETDVVASLQALAEAHPRLWLVPVRANNWDREGVVEHWLSRHADRVAEKAFAGLRLQLYETAQRYQEIMTPVDAVWGERIRLRGFALRLEDEPLEATASLSPGATLQLVLYWQALAPPAKSYTVFTHLLDPQGVLRGQKDAPPLTGSYPTDLWQAGEQIVDRYDIPLDFTAPPGEYVLEIGLYEWPANQRLAVADSAGRALGDHLILARITVKSAE